MSMTANINRDSKKHPKPYQAIEFMNYVKQPEEKKLTTEECNTLLKGFFGGCSA